VRSTVTLKIGVGTTYLKKDSVHFPINGASPNGLIKKGLFFKKLPQILSETYANGLINIYFNQFFEQSTEEDLKI
jgi:hypothetical protein